jgi:hypothetical protein
VADCGLAQAEAVPMALVLNELLSNAVKHGGRFGAVRLQLQRAGRHEAAVVYLRIVNGVGLDNPDVAGGSPPTGTACGLALVAALLPPAGARLRQQVRGRQFFSELELEPPVVIWRKSENGVDSTVGAAQQQGMGSLNKEKLEA